VSKTATRISKLSTVVVPVSDQDRAIEFYVDTLGFEKRTDVPFGNGYRWVEVGPADAVTTIAIVPPPPGKPTGNVETGIALYSEDVDADHQDLKARGVDVDAEVSRMGGPVPPMFWFRDPDGNSLLVVG
jgi:catechol 2,3-dioxygenase-like lactoylglutathione lyase family enzyme